MKIDRRRFIAATLIPALSGSLMVQAAFGQMVPAWPDAATDLTETLQAAIDGARDTGHLALPAGRFSTRGLRLPSGFMLTGVPGATQLVHLAALPCLAPRVSQHRSGRTVDRRQRCGRRGVAWRTCPLCRLRERDHPRLRGFQYGAQRHHADEIIRAGRKLPGERQRLYGAVRLRRRRRLYRGQHHCRMRQWGHQGLARRSGRRRHNHFGQPDLGHRLGRWWERAERNGINIFRADEVIVSGNHISDCAFSAVRLNATNNTHITGNTCLASGEVAIFSEFSFTGSVIANTSSTGPQLASR